LCLPPVFKLWFRSSEPFVGICDLGALRGHGSS
jgi:hypothetical protein